MKIYAMTDVGRRREVNQDYVYVTDEPIGPFPNLLVVADGKSFYRRLLVDSFRDCKAALMR